MTAPTDSIISRRRLSVTEKGWDLLGLQHDVVAARSSVSPASTGLAALLVDELSTYPIATCTFQDMKRDPFRCRYRCIKRNEQLSSPNVNSLSNCGLRDSRWPPLASTGTAARRYGNLRALPLCSDSDGRWQLLGEDFELFETVRTVGRDHRNICGVAPAGNQNPPDSWLIVTSIERVPATAKESLKPGVEVHWRRIRRHPDIAEIAIAVTRGNIHTAAKGHREVGKVSTNAATVLERLNRGPSFARLSVAKGKPIMHKVADRLNRRPAISDSPELPPCKIGKQIRFAIATRRKKRQRLRRNRGYRADVSARIGFIWAAIVLKYAVESQFQGRGPRGQASDRIAEDVSERLIANRRIKR
jgi:hypothetical protein